MPNKKQSKVKETKVDQDPVKEWKSRLEAIAKERRANEDHKERLQQELRRLIGNRKAHEQHIKEQAAIEFKAQKDKSSGALVDSIFKLDKGRIPESVQLELNIIASQGALSECHAEGKRLEAEESQLLRKIQNHVLTEGIKSFDKSREKFITKYQELRECFNELVFLSKENAKFDTDWVQLMGKSTTPEEIKPKSKLDFEFALVFEPRNLPTRTLLNTLERLRSFQDIYGPNVFADVPSQFKHSPDNVIRDSFEGGGPTVINEQDRNLERVIDNALAGF